MVIYKRNQSLRNTKLKKEILYRKDQKNNGKLLKVIRRHELEVVMFIMHDHSISAHFASRTTFEKMKERYYWPKMYDDIKTYVDSCDQCQRKGRPKIRMNYTRRNYRTILSNRNRHSRTTT